MLGSHEYLKCVSMNHWSEQLMTILVVNVRYKIWLWTSQQFLLTVFLRWLRHQRLQGNLLSITDPVQKQKLSSKNPLVVMRRDSIHFLTAKLQSDAICILELTVDLQTHHIAWHQSQEFIIKNIILSNILSILMPVEGIAVGDLIM